ERVLTDGTAADAHAPAAFRLAPEGSASWAEGWEPGAAAAGARPLPALCQDRLDFDEALRFNGRCRQAGTAWLRARAGPLARAYVGPLFLPAAGPCLGCLLPHFRRLSPAPDLYDALADHARAGRPLAPAPFPPPAAAIVRQLLRWKADLAAQAEAPAA